MSRPRKGEWAAGAAGLVTLFGLFALDWYGDAGGSIGAWEGQGVLGTLANLVILAAALLALALPVVAATARSGALAAVTASFTGLLAWFAAGCAVGRIVWRPGPGFDLGLELGIFVTLAGTAACFVGSFVAMRDEGPGN